jgi:hypothetical protein
MLDSLESTPAWRRPYRGQRLVAGFMRPLDVSRAVEYLAEAIDEAEAAARWYAERSGSAATGFADEVDAAIAAIEAESRRVAAVRSRHSSLLAASVTVQRGLPH